mgnify:CR=1 FL=1
MPCYKSLWMLLKIQCFRFFRKVFLSAMRPIVLGIREFDLETALDKEPWQIPEWRRKRETSVPCLRKVIESDSGGVVRKDRAISFSPYHREYGYRGVKESLCCPQLTETTHDPMAEL